MFHICFTEVILCIHIGVWIELVSSEIIRSSSLKVNLILHIKMVLTALVVIVTKWTQLLFAGILVNKGEFSFLSAANFYGAVFKL